MAIYSLQIEKHALSGLIRHPEAYADIESFLTENDFVTVGNNKINVAYGFKWQYLTSPESQYPNGEYFSSSRTDEFIGKQIIEFTALIQK